MQIPKLSQSSRSREFNKYSDIQRAEVVRAWLFDGRHHREIDKEILHLDPEYSHGYQSMGILHYIGLRREFQGLFYGMTNEQAVVALKETNDPAYQKLIDILSG